jgi:DNA-binding beta-propeller fold protein YncE
MRKATGKRAWLGVLCTVALAFALAPASAQAAPSDPLFLFSAGSEVPPGTGFEGPCGLSVDKNGSFYVSDYYHDAVDAFSSNRGYLTQLTGVDPLDGPCATAVDSSGRLYVNDYHRKVVRYTPSSFPVGPGSFYGVGVTIDSKDPTGLAVDPASDYLYVNERTQIALFEPSGAPVILAGEEVTVGAGSLQDGYGLAISGFPSTAGRLYVADAKDEVVKVYDPAAANKEDPVEVIDGHAVPSGGFSSLRDAAIAVDRVTGEVYVADDIDPAYTERPEATVYVFSSSGAYEGHLKFNVLDARPPGLAVDNSPGGTQGRVYVTSGNSEDAIVYGYGPGAVTTSPPLCAPGGFCGGQGSGGSGAAAAASPAGIAAASSSTAAQGPPASASELAQKGTLRISVDGALSPRRLPRKGEAPIAVTVGGKIATTDGSRPPQLQALRIELNRHGRLDFAGLPTCPYNLIQPASSSRALSACRSALVGEGSFEAEITLAGQEPYPTQGKLLLFNGKSHGKPVLFGQIYSSHPFATSFVIIFAIKKIPHGTYGTELSAQLPSALGSWGNLTGIQMRLARRYSYRGESRSYLSAGCPAPKGFGQVSFPLARASFGFDGGRTLSSTLNRSCRANG